MSPSPPETEGISVLMGTCRHSLWVDALHIPQGTALATCRVLSIGHTWARTRKESHQLCPRGPL